MRREYLSALGTAGLVACFLGPLEAKPLEVISKEGSLRPRLGGLRQLQEVTGFGADPSNLPLGKYLVTNNEELEAKNGELKALLPFCLDLCQGDCDTNDDVRDFLIHAGSL